MISPGAYHGNDYMDGGTGADTLYGAYGSDTYLFGRGAGMDTIWEYSVLSEDVDTIIVAADVKPGDIVLSRVYNQAANPRPNDLLMYANKGFDALIAAKCTERSRTMRSRACHF